MWGARFTRGLRAAGSAAGATAVAACGAAACESPSLAGELAKLRETEAIFRERWLKDEDGWRKLPPRSWPAYQPPAEKVPALEAALDQCPKNAGAPMSQDCAKAHFDYATALVFASVDPLRGLERYTELAEGGHVDGMVAVGVTLLEGNGVP